MDKDMQSLPADDGEPNEPPGAGNAQAGNVDDNNVDRMSTQLPPSSSALEADDSPEKLESEPSVGGDDGEHAISAGAGREGRDRRKKRSSPKKVSSETETTPRLESKRLRDRPRSNSRSRVLTERVMFFEQVWQGSSSEPQEAQNKSPSVEILNVTTRTTEKVDDDGEVRIIRSRSSRELESEFAKEIDALEKRLEQQKQRFKSGDVFLEHVTLRHTPTSSREGYLSPEPEFIHHQLIRSRSSSRLSSEREYERRVVSPDIHSSLIRRSETVSYETITRFPEGEGDEEQQHSKMEHSSSKSPVYDELVTHSSGGDGESGTSTPHHPVMMTKYETRSQVVPGRVSIKYEAVGGGGPLSPTSARSATPSEDVSDFSASGSSGSRLSSSKMAKYEFLGVTADAISRSRTPSGGTSISSFRSGSPRIGDSNTSLGGGHHVTTEHHQYQTTSGQRRLVVTTKTTTTSEMKSIRMARSPSSGIGSIASPTSDISPRIPQSSSSHFVDNPDNAEANVHKEKTDDILITRKVVSSSYQQTPSSKGGSVVQTPTSVGSESEDLLSGGGGVIVSSNISVRGDRTPRSASSLSSPAGTANSPAEWYTQYKSKVVAPTPGRFETDVSKSAKSKAAFFDSHIAEIKGKEHEKTILFLHNFTQYHAVALSYCS
ncbi:unnamed protein product [Orchesella dallaii]|uniref:Uncharacterized protein n=1 Tax=Orchesella dallaii TaxID=48710 RepID=A0ABP1QUT0_9HEXA